MTYILDICHTDTCFMLFSNRGVVDESGDQFVAYFLPTEETVKKRKRDVENNEDYVEDEE